MKSMQVFTNKISHRNKGGRKKKLKYSLPYIPIHMRVTVMQKEISKKIYSCIYV